MRVGLNLLYLLPGVVGGTETYARGLLSGLAEENCQAEFTVFVNKESEGWTLPDRKNFFRVVCNVQAGNRFARYAYEQLLFPGLLKQFHLDVVHSLGYTGPLHTGCKSIITIHDLNYIAFGSRMPVVRRLGLKLFVCVGALTADHIIAVSEFSRGEIQQHLGIAAEKVTVVHEAPHPFRKRAAHDAGHDLLNRLGVQYPYWVAFSSTSPNKNILNLVNAFRRIRNVYGLRNQLVLIGHQHSEGSRAGASLHEEGILVTGYLDDSQLSSVLCRSQMLIFPSTYEGFGLPVLEAMECGVPVVCSGVASLPEVAGDAAVFFDPWNPEDMAEKIVSVATNEEWRESMRTLGRENLKRFSWAKTARETMRVYEQVVRSR